MVEEWYREANNCADVKVLTRVDVEKALGVIKQEQLELSGKLKSVNQTCSSAEAGLKTAERQAEEQR